MAWEGFGTWLWNLGLATRKKTQNRAEPERAKPTWKGNGHRGSGRMAGWVSVLGLALVLCALVPCFGLGCLALAWLWAVRTQGGMASRLSWPGSFRLAVLGAFGLCLLAGPRVWFGRVSWPGAFLLGWVPCVCLGLAGSLGGWLAPSGGNPQALAAVWCWPGGPGAGLAPGVCLPGAPWAGAACLAGWAVGVRVVSFCAVGLSCWVVGGCVGSWSWCLGGVLMGSRCGGLVWRGVRRFSRPGCWCLGLGAPGGLVP